MDKEKLKLNLDERYSGEDEEFKSLLEELCFEIDKIDTDDLFAARILEILPYELAMFVVLNLKYSQDVYIGLLNTFYFDSFCDDIKIKAENGKTQFRNRLIVQKELNYKTFATTRLLTIGEIENLISIFIEQEKEITTVEDVVAGRYQGKGQNIKNLIQAHKYLSLKENLENTNKIMKKMNKLWLEMAKIHLVSYRQEKREG